MLHGQNNYTIVVHTKEDDVFSIKRKTPERKNKMNHQIMRTDVISFGIHQSKTFQMNENSKSFGINYSFRIYENDEPTLFAIDTLFVVGKYNHKEISYFNWYELQNNNNHQNFISVKNSTLLQSSIYHQKNYNFIPQRIIVVK